MSSWTDIDGSEVMAGTPGILDCLDIQFRELLGSLPGQRDGKALFGRVNIESVERLLLARGNEALRRRVVLAGELVALAKRLLTWKQGEAADVTLASELVARLSERLPKRVRDRGEYWWREVDAWGNDGSKGPLP